jgi:hypothetical protein
MRLLAIATVVGSSMLVSSCGDPNAGLASASHGPRNEIGSTCAAMASRKWNATLSRVNGASPKYLLNVVGEVDLPTPGYTPIWKMGISDRGNPPGLQLSLTFDPPKEVDAQVVTINTVRYSTEVSWSRLRYINVVCGDATLSRIPDIGG